MYWKQWMVSYKSEVKVPKGTNIKNIDTHHKIYVGISSKLFCNQSSILSFFLLSLSDKCLALNGWKLYKRETHFCRNGCKHFYSWNMCTQVKRLVAKISPTCMHNGNKYTDKCSIFRKQRGKSITSKWIKESKKVRASRATIRHPRVSLLFLIKKIEVGGFLY